MKFVFNSVGLAFAAVVTTILTANAQTAVSDEALNSCSQAIESEVPKERLPENWSDADVFRLRTFAEPLVGDVRAPNEEERATFSKAINAYLLDGQPENLEAFLRQRPESRWTAALKHNLGLLKYRQGFFTAAVSYWQSAWDGARDSKDPRLRALANQALAELAGMQARLGRIEVLRPLLGIVKEREVGGSARQMLSTSADALQEMESRPEKCFKCGPFALAAVRQALGISNALGAEILEIKSPYRGFSLTEVSQLATKLGMANQMTKWIDGATEIPAPSVVHWKLGHYAAIIAEQAGKYRLKDLTFGFDSLVSAEAIRAEASGYFLLANANLPQGFELVSASEGWQVFGRGYTNRDMPNQVTEGDLKLPSKPECRGMVDYSVHAMIVSLHLEDTPVGYSPPFGPSIGVKVSYNERETLQPANLNFTNFGRQWTHNWNGSIKVTTTSAATVVLRGGGSEDHRINPSDPGFSYLHPKSHAQLLKLGETRWERRLPDDSKEVYETLVNPDGQGLGTFWLTQVVDAAGNAVTLQYDAEYRLSTVTDALVRRRRSATRWPKTFIRFRELRIPLGGPLALAMMRTGSSSRSPTLSAWSLTLPMTVETSSAR